MSAKERVEEECKELSKKIEGLEIALTANGYGNLAIPQEQIYLLEIQYAIMRAYQRVLEQRLRIWQD